MNTKAISGVLLALPFLPIPNPRSAGWRLQRLVAALFVLLSSFAIRHSSLAQGTGFTYQGRLSENGMPATGTYDLQVTIYDTAIRPGGNAIAGPLYLPTVPVSNGLFTATLDFGSGVFNGNARWVEIGVRTNGSLAVHQLLLPRQAITATPYAIQAAGIAGTLPDAQLSANIPRLSSSITFTSGVTFDPAGGSPFSITGGSSNKLVKGLNADKLGGKDVTNFMLRAGDTMTGPLNLPPNGLAVGSDQLVVANGRVGLGTANPVGALDVRPHDAASGPGSSVVIKAQKGAASHVGGNVLLSSGDNGVNSENGYIAFGIGAGVAGSGFSVNEKMRIAATGYLGIGTATPQARLTVAGGDVLIDEGRFLLGGIANGGFEQLIRSRGMGYDNVGYPGVQIGQERDHIALFIDPRSVAGGAFDGGIENEIMTPNKLMIRQANRIGDNWLLGPTFDDGKVGIGTENPIDALSLGFGRSMSFDANDSAQTSRLRWRYQGNEYEWIERPHLTGGLAFGTDQLERMRIDNYGNVGIGTTTPWTKLTLAGRASPYQVYRDDPVLLLSDTNSLRVADEGVSLGFNRGAHFLYGAIKGAASNSDPNKFDGYLAFFTTDFTSAHEERMRILGNGNLGISTAHPQERLHVAGNIAVSAPNHLIARYQNSNNDYSASLGWNSLQLGNNGANYIIAGRTERSGSLIFVTDNTNDYNPSTLFHNGKEVMALLPNGNVGIGTANPSETLHVMGSIIAEGTGGGGRVVMKGTASGGHQYEWYPDAPAVGDLRLYDRTLGADAFVVKADGKIGIGTGIPGSKLEVAGTITCTTLVQTSDRNAKERFSEVDARQILARLAAIPMQTWNYTNDTAKTRHIGPMAQDFHAAFGVGADDKHIATVDADGVTFAAIQGLYEVVQEKDARITSLENELAELKRLVQSLARGNKGN